MEGVKLLAHLALPRSLPSGLNGIAIFPIACFALSIAGCGGSANQEEFSLPWPQSIEPVAPCTPYAPGFVEPDLADPSGDVRILFSSPLEPTGVSVRVEIRVFETGTEVLDASATGTVAVDVGAVGEVVEQTAVESGRAVVWIRFDEPGQHVISAQANLLDGTRTGEVEIATFTSQLPIWQVAIDNSDWAKIKADPLETIKVPIDLEVGGQSYSGTVRLHGGSSREFPKKSLRIDLDDKAIALGEEHIILRAEYADKSLLRNWLGYELFSNGTWLPTPKSELVHLRMNGEYYGVMNHVERIGSDFLASRGMGKSGSLYEADPPRAFSVPGGNMTPLGAIDDYRVVYQHHQGSILYDDLIDLIEGILQESNSTFEKEIGSRIVVEDVIVYYAMMAIIQNHDHVRKNFYIYSDTEGEDDRWKFIPWDLDLAFGHLWTEENDVLDETISFDADPFVGVKTPSRFGYYNHLMDRLLTRQQFRDLFLGMMGYMIDSSFNQEFVDERLDSAVCRATPDILADHRKRATNAEYLGRVDEVREFVSGRRKLIESISSIAPPLVPQSP